MQFICETVQFLNTERSLHRPARVHVESIRAVFLELYFYLLFLKCVIIHYSRKGSGKLTYPSGAPPTFFLSMPIVVGKENWSYILVHFILIIMYISICKSKTLNRIYFCLQCFDGCRHMVNTIFHSCWLFNLVIIALIV